MKNISKPSLKGVQIAVPELGEQVRIAEAMQSIESRIYRSNHKLKMLGSMKKALMQDLLTGKVRVNVDINNNSEERVAV